MTAATSEIIDLGVLEQSEARPRGPIFPPRARRAGLSAIVAVLCLLSLGASAIGDRGFSTPLWTGTVDIKGFNLASDVLLSTRSDRRAVIGRDLRTGDQLWEFEVATTLEYTMDLGNGFMAIATEAEQDQLRPDGPSGRTMTLLRARTGEKIGQIVGTTDVVGSDGVTLLVRTVRGNCPAADSGCWTMIGWDLATSRPMWHEDLPSQLVVGLSAGEPDYGVVMVGRDGLVEVRDPATGAVRASARLPEAAEGGQVAMLRDVLITTNRAGDGDRVTVKGYERTGLRPIWAIDVPSAPGSQRQGMATWLSACGDDACVHTDNGPVRLIDVATGEVKAETDLALTFRLANGMFLGSKAEPTNGNLPTSLVPGFILDRNLRVLGELRADDQIWSHDSLDHALFTRNGPDRTTFLGVDQEGRQQLLGSVSGARLQCAVHGRYLACVDNAGTLRVWQLPSDWQVTS